jgi:hypothetical protein
MVKNVRAKWIDQGWTGIRQVRECVVNNPRRRTEETDELACLDSQKTTLSLNMCDKPFGANMPWDVRGSPRFLL